MQVNFIEVISGMRLLIIYVLRVIRRPLFISKLLVVRILTKNGDVRYCEPGIIRVACESLLEDAFGRTSCYVVHAMMFLLMNCFLNGSGTST